MLVLDNQSLVLGKIKQKLDFRVFDLVVHLSVTQIGF
jgi:hypothetical protein